MRTARREWWAAGLLSLVTPGLGQMYNGQIKKGLLLYGLIWTVLPVSLLIAIVLPLAPFNVIGATLLLLSAFSYIVIDAISTARRHRESFQAKSYNKWYVYLIVFSIATFGVQPILGNLIRDDLVQAYRIPSGAMLPTLQIGDHIFVDKLVYRSKNPNRGDIIVFSFPYDESRDFVKRVIGLPGEVVKIRKRKVYINGTPLEESYAMHTDPAPSWNPRSPRDFYGPTTVPKGKLFVLGDNRDHSQDSRYWGFLNISKVKGRVSTIYFSWDSSANRVRWNRIGQSIRGVFW